MKRSRYHHLLNTADQITNTSALKARQIAFIPRLMATTSLPVRKTQAHEFIRRNGNRTLMMLASSEIGLPYGGIPRLALCAITTLAKQSQSRMITLGPSMAQFLKLMGKSSTGGKNGSLTHTREQLKRLLSCTIQITEEDDQRWQMTSLRVAQRASILWHPTDTDHWQSTLTLTEEFFTHIQEYAIPVDQRVLHALGHYPLAMDIYCWLTYRYFSLTRITLIPWSCLINQFGNCYHREAHFRDNFTKALCRVQLFYPQAWIIITPVGVELHPSPTHIPTRDLFSC